MTRDTRNRRSSSADFGELSKRKRAETLEGFAALVGGAVRAAREGPRVLCRTCGKERPLNFWYQCSECDQSTKSENPR